MAKHLWEVDHAYYCNQGNYFARESVESYFESFADFMEEFGDSDMDYNLLFRWDWEEEDDNGDANFNGDVNYRNGKLLIFWMGQRKGLYQYSVVKVCRADEPAVIEFLRPRWEYLRKLWEPIDA
jgi:hypothetical protein